MIYFQQICVILATLLTYVYCIGIHNLTDLTSKISVRESENNEAVCRYRDWVDLYPPHLFVVVTGAFCFSYSQDSKLSYRLPLYSGTLENLLVPFTEVDGEIVLFDYTDEAYVSKIKPTFSEERFFNQWVECARLADECCRYKLDATNVIPNDEYVCPALWDGWDCWPSAKAGQTLKRTCPTHIYTSSSIECQLKSEKYCLEDGWNQTTNYATCSTAPILRRRHNFHVIVLAVSTALTIPAILIFVIFMRNQKNLRIILYRNLLIVIVLKNIFTIMSKKIIILDALKGESYTNNVMNDNSVGCRILTFFDSFATTAVFTCMFVIGFYLHKTIARVFSKDLNIYLLYTIIIGFSFIPTLIWAIVMGVSNQPFCWIVDLKGYQWITDAYKYAVLIVNLVLLLDIVRVIWTRRFNLNSEQTKTAVKATLVLVPLFGIPLLITSQRSLIDEKSCLSGDIYYFIAYSVEALQGVIVALLFCYLNKDVHMEIKRSYAKCVNSLNTRFGWNLRVPMQARVTVVSNLRTSVADTPNPLPLKKTGTTSI